MRAQLECWNAELWNIVGCFLRCRITNGVSDVILGPWGEWQREGGTWFLNSGMGVDHYLWIMDHGDMDYGVTHPPMDDGTQTQPQHTSSEHALRTVGTLRGYPTARYAAFRAVHHFTKSVVHRGCQGREPGRLRKDGKGASLLPSARLFPAACRMTNGGDLRV